MFSLEILVQNGSPLSTLSEGSWPYACYKNSAYVSDSGMNEIQPTHVYTPQTAARMEFSLQDGWAPWREPWHLARKGILVGHSFRQLS